MVKQILQLHLQGWSNRAIANEPGIDKETVNVHIRKVKANGFAIEELLKLEDPELERVFMAGSAAYADPRYDRLKELLPHYEQELKRKHVTRGLLWKEYIAVHPDGYRYTQFCFHLNQLPVARKPAAHIEHSPGEKLYIDFAGDTVEFCDRDTVEVRKAQVFVATFPYSNYTFAMACASRSTDDFLHALACCLSSFGGSPKIVVPDNLKAAVIKTGRYEPDLNKIMEDFANHYGFVVLPARVRRSRDKASVENEVKIIYHRVYARLRDRTFFSIEDINQAFREKVREHNQTRMQRNEYSREEKFLSEEKPALIPLPSAVFEKKYYTELLVAGNNYIYLGRDKHYYSVPYAYIGKKVLVIYTRTLVQIYCDGRSIAILQRRTGFGYTTVHDHLCSSHRHYLNRSPAYYIEQGGKRSAVLEKLICRIFEKAQTPETVYNRCEGLLGLYRKTEHQIFERACQIALDNGQLTFKFVENVIKNRTWLLFETGEDDEQTSLPEPDCVRGREYYI
jgi:transposase